MKNLIALLTFVICSTTANAAIISFTDRASFDGAVGTSVIEDFESFVTEEAFHTVSLDLGDFTVSMTGSPNTTSYNYIDIPPIDSSESDVNGSNNMRVFTEAFSPTSLTFLFDSAITAFGADFRSLNDAIARTQLVVDGTIVTLPIAGASGEFSFFGLTSNSGFTSITFEGLENDVFGIDNVTFAAAVVSEPSTFAFLLLGAVGLFLRRKA